MRAFQGGAVLCYIGNGKGKTTAAVGAAVRARGYGQEVLFFQFFKSSTWPSGERESLEKIGIRVVVSGRGFVGILGDTRPKGEHKKAAQKALKSVQASIRSKRFLLIVLDEIVSAVEAGLLTQKDIMNTIQIMRSLPKNAQPHLILTGHRKYPTILKHCDLVTEMKKITHPYYMGFLAIKGIDY